MASKRPASSKLANLQNNREWDALQDEVRAANAIQKQMGCTRTEALKAAKTLVEAATKARSFG